MKPVKITVQHIRLLSLFFPAEQIDVRLQPEQSIDRKDRKILTEESSNDFPLSAKPGVQRGQMGQRRGKHSHVVDPIPVMS